MDHQALITKLGGVAAVSKLCEVSQPAVSWWWKNGIPKLRLIQIKSLKPEAFDNADTEAVQPTTTISGD